MDTYDLKQVAKFVDGLNKLSDDTGVTIYAESENASLRVNGEAVGLRLHDDYDPNGYSIEIAGRRLMPKSLAVMAVEVEENNREHGWYEADRTFGDEIALLHSEASEALEAFRSFKFATVTRNVDGKPEDVASELADVLIRLLDTTKRHGIDLEAEYERKMAFNRTRPYLHGGKAL